MARTSKGIEGCVPLFGVRVAWFVPLSSLVTVETSLEDLMSSLALLMRGEEGVGDIASPTSRMEDDSTDVKDCRRWKEENEVARLRVLSRGRGLFLMEGRVKITGEDGLPLE